jgi:hypothetical protein
MISKERLCAALKSENFNKPAIAKAYAPKLSHQFEDSKQLVSLRFVEAHRFRSLEHFKEYYNRKKQNSPPRLWL